MAFLCETPDRRVIPNWRSLSDTISNGELEYPQYDEKKVFDLFEYDLTSSLKKYVFHNWLINNILYFRVT